MLKSVSKFIWFLILCILVAAASGCGDISGSRFSTDTETPDAAATAPADTSFKFGVMGDTQWYFDLVDPEGTNKETVAGSIITQINDEMIMHGVEFVIQVGDLTNYGYDAAIAARAEYAQPLYDAGIGFFPMRGNHEPWGNLEGMSPVPEDNGYAVPAIQANFPQNQGVGPNTGGATNFSSPTNADYPMMATELAGMSYAFDYDDGAGNSATFVIIDDWQTDSMGNALFAKDYSALYGFLWVLGYPYGYPINSQQDWISDRIGNRVTDHAFVFSHQGLMLSNHEDSIFGFSSFEPTDITDESDPTYVYPSYMGWPDGFVDPVTDAPDNSADANLFFADLVANDVAFFICGHDHLHDLARVASPDGLSSVDQIICAPACSKFYHPAYTSPEWRGGKTRRTVIDAEQDNIGYYVYTVDGPIVTVDYYSDKDGGFYSGGRASTGFQYPYKGDTSLITPDFTFVKKNTYLYSLNGKSFMVAQGEPYRGLTDTYGGTTVAFGGWNSSKMVEDPTGTAEADAAAMPLTKRIATGWKDQDEFVGIDSNAVMVYGFKETNLDAPDKYVLRMSTASSNSSCRIVTQDDSGNWVEAALQTANTQKFMSGAASIAYDAGTYGFERATNSAWVVLDYEGIFALKQFP